MTVEAPIQNCEFKYKCPKDWFELEESDNNNIRHCIKCDKNVYFCENKAKSDLIGQIVESSNQFDCEFLFLIFY